MKAAPVILALLAAVLLHQTEGLRYRRPNRPRPRPEPEPEPKYPYGGKAEPEYPYGEPEVQPEKQNVCELPMVTGRCRAAMKRWYYDSSMQKCSTFIYGGCGANGNNFKTETECTKRCKGGGTDQTKMKRKKCPYGQRKAQCYVSPCKYAKCPAMPDAICRVNTCGGCFAEFYVAHMNVTAQCHTGSHKYPAGSGSGSVHKGGHNNTYTHGHGQGMNYTTGHTHGHGHGYGRGHGNGHGQGHRHPHTYQNTTAYPYPETHYTAYPEPPAYPEGHGTQVGDMNSKLDSMRQLAQLAEQKGLLHPAAPRNISGEPHPNYPDRMKVCLCY